MSRLHILIATGLVFASVEASAQSARAYVCTISSDGSQVYIMFGSNEVRYRSNSAGGGWGENICDADSDCYFEGPMFYGLGSDFYFKYNGSDGRFSFKDNFRTIEGTCRPE